MSSFRDVLFAANWRNLEEFLAWQYFQNFQASEKTSSCFVPLLCFGYFEVLEVDHGHTAFFLADVGFDSTFHSGFAAFQASSSVDSVDLILGVPD